ncbi:element-binding protein [Musa troglodytarum]|uniref:Element-binding protein n=1 Tax=Musa troglodytarum TaxID=320322 RepID=A0A9E7LA48_9LILI|nr:element-binding protein [Musa troglodytarum]
MGFNLMKTCCRLRVGRLWRSKLSGEGRVKDLTRTLAAQVSSRKPKPRESSRARKPRTFGESPRDACTTAAAAVATRHPRPILFLPPFNTVAEASRPLYKYLSPSPNPTPLRAREPGKSGKHQGGMMVPTLWQKPLLDGESTTVNRMLIIVSVEHRQKVQRKVV